MTNMTPELFTSSETSKITSLSQRQLQYWDDTDLVCPSVLRAQGRGSRRLYSEQDLFRLKVIKGLLDVGMSVQSVRRSLVFLRKLFYGNQPLDEIILVSDGHSIYAYRDTDTILDTLHDGQQVFRLALGELTKEVRHEIDRVFRGYAHTNAIR